MVLQLSHQFTLICLLIMKCVKGTQTFDSSRDVEQDEKLKDRLIAEFERQELREQQGGFLMQADCRATTLPGPIGRFAKHSGAITALYPTFAFDVFSTTTINTLSEFSEGFMLAEGSNMTYWEKFSKEFEPCLHIQNVRHQFRLNMLPNGLLVLSNVSVQVSDVSAVAGLLKTYYDVALWRINKLSNFNQQNMCFQSLNSFICGILMDNLHHLKLKAVACYRVKLPFSSFYAPQYRGESLLNDNARESCAPPESGYYIQFDGKCYLYSCVPLDLELNEINYYEEGCLNFFNQRIEGGLNFYQTDVLGSVPTFTDVLTLTFPDGSALTFNANDILDVIHKFWTCQMLEILAIRNRESRMCYVQAFQSNFDRFLAEAIPHLRQYALDMGKLTVFQTLMEKQRVVMRTFAARYDPIAQRKMLNLTSTTIKFPVLMNLSGESAIQDPASEDSNMSIPLNGDLKDADSDIQDNLQIIRRHILNCFYVFYTWNRKSVSLAIPTLIREGLHSNIAGSINSAQNSAYAISKFAAGILSDSVDPRLLLTVGLISGGLTTVVFAVVDSSWLYILLWFCNGLAQGFGWPACAKLLKLRYSSSQFALLWSYLSCSSNISLAVNSVVSAYILQNYGWRTAVSLAGVVSMAMGAACFVLLESNDLNVLKNDKKKEKILEKKSGKNQLPAKDLFFQVILQPLMLRLLLTNFVLMLVKNTISDWTQLYLINEADCSPILASVFIGNVEIGGIIGTIASGYVSELVMKSKNGKSLYQESRRLMTVVLFMTGLCVSMTLLCLINGSSPKIIIMIIGFILGASTYGPINISGIVSSQSVPQHMSGTFHAFFALAGNPIDHRNRVAVVVMSPITPISVNAKNYQSFNEGWTVLTIFMWRRTDTTKVIVLKFKVGLGPPGSWYLITRLVVTNDCNAPRKLPLTEVADNSTKVHRQ
ncbi:hypothetical protein CHUAL_013129 [Chamberlinius hualienensis]